MLEIKQLCLSYPKADKALLESIDIHLEAGQMLILKGANGCGKTSLLNCLAGIIPEHIHAHLSGSILLSGNDLGYLPLRERFHYLAYQMSDPDTQIFFPDTEKELCFALENQGLPADLIRQRIDNAAQRFDLSGIYSQDPSTLSQGQKKLLLFAICAAMDTALILLDEPSAGLSDRGIDMLNCWLIDAKHAGKIIIAAEHATALDHLATSILHLGSGL